MAGREDAVRARVSAWRAELASTRDRARLAAIHHEIGHLLEHELADRDAAVGHYREAIAASPRFRPPLFALARLFERAGDAAALEELTSLEARAARTPAEEASALIERARLLEDHLARGPQARPLLVRALERDPGSREAALALEVHLRRAGDGRGAAEATARRAELTGEPALADALRLEIRLHAAIGGAVEDTLEWLRERADDAPESWRLLRHMADLATALGRADELSDAQARLAALAEQEARGVDPKPGTLPGFPSRAAARAVASALWHDAAMSLSRRADAAKEALAILDKALALAPQDLLLRWDRMDLLARAGDQAAAIREARSLLDRAGEGPHEAALQVRIAEIAADAGDAATRRSALEAAAAADPDSAAVGALLAEAVRAGGDPGQVVAWLESRTARRSDRDRARLLWEAAQIAADQLGDWARARALYERAVELARDPIPILREQHGAALRLGFEAEDASERLAGADISAGERSALLFDRYQELDDPDMLLAMALAMDPPPRWAPHVARIRAARSGDALLTVAAHRALASEDADDALAAAHLCAAGRALARSGDLEGARAALEEGRARSPGSPYAAGLLEEVLRASGDFAAAAEVLIDDARSADDPRIAEPMLLRAAAAARAAERDDLATEAYRVAAALDPPSRAALARLLEIASHDEDPELRVRALESLAEREGARGRPARATFALGEHHELVEEDSDRARPHLEAVLPDEKYGPAAAVCVLTSTGLSDAHHAAAARLVEFDHGAGAIALRRVAGAAAASRADARERVAELAGAVLESRPDDRWALLVQLRGTDPARDAPAHAAALARLAAATTDRAAAAELYLLAVAHDPASVEPGDVAERAEGPVEAALLEAVATSAAARVAALEARIGHAVAAHRPGLSLALGRALLDAGRADDAIARLREELVRDPTDLAAWEALRVAGRIAERPAIVVDACTRLAEEVDGEPRAELLEEAAIALLGPLDRPDEAEGLLARVAQSHPERPATFARLLSRYRQRGDDERELALVTACVDRNDDAEQLVDLLREQARLRARARDHAGVVEALQNLLLIEPQDVGAHALLAETLVRLDALDEAVEALGELAACPGVSPELAMGAHVAAARYRRTRLRDPAGALASYRALEALGHEEEALFVRMADAAEEAGLAAEARAALARAAGLAGGEARAAHERRAATLAETDEDRAASLRRALAAHPTDFAAASALASRLEGDARARVGADLRAAILDREDGAPTSAHVLRHLRACATWEADAERELVALLALEALASPTDEEREALARLSPSPAAPTGSLEATPAASPLGHAVARAEAALAAMDGLDPSKLGVGRRERVKDDADSAVRDAVLGVARGFGLGHERFHVGGHDERAMIAVPRDDHDPTWVVGAGVQAPLGPADRYRLGHLCQSLAAGTSAITRRPAAEATRLVRSIAHAAGAPIADDDGDAAVAKALPRKVRKAITEALRGAGATADGAAALVAEAHEAAACAGAVVAADLAVALDAILGRRDVEAVRSSAPATAVVRFWLSDEHPRRRAALGLAAAGEATPPITGALGPTTRAPAAADVDALFDDSDEDGDEGAWNVTASDLWQAVADDWPRLLVAAPPHAPPTDDQGRLRLLGALAEGRGGAVAARLHTAMSERRAASGDAAGARAELARARVADPTDPIALRRTRADAARSGDREVARRLLDEEIALDVAPVERAVLHAELACARRRQGDAAGAESEARRALADRPAAVAIALLVADLERADGRAAEAAATMEALAERWRDPMLRAAVHGELARVAETAWDTAGARVGYARALSEDASALEAKLGLARCARALGEHDVAVDALLSARELVRSREVSEALTRTAARVRHLVQGRPDDARALLASGTEMATAEAAAEAASAVGDRAALLSGLAARAAAARRGERAITLARLAEAHLSGGALDEAAATLRDAGRADPTLHMVRVIEEEIARRRGDVQELTRISQRTIRSPALAAARAALSPEHDDLEDRLLRAAHADDPGDASVAALLLDRAAREGDDPRLRELLQREAEATRSAAHKTGALVALSELVPDDEATQLLEEAWLGAAGDLAPSRTLVAIAMAQGDPHAAELWLEEAAGTDGEHAAFAATMAGRLQATAGEDATPTFRRALAACADYGPALWAIEADARRRGDEETLREVLVMRAEQTDDPLDEAQHLVQAAIVSARADGSLLQRAHEVIPHDYVLDDMRLRMSHLGRQTGHALRPADRAELLARSAAGAPPGLARALRLRAARAFEDAGEPGRAADIGREVLEEHPGDVLAEHLLDRAERAAGQLDRIEERLALAVDRAADTTARALALDRLATFERTEREDPEAALEFLRELSELRPVHVPTARTLERLAMEQRDDALLAEVESRLARLTPPDDARAHARLAARLLRRAGGPAAADELLTAAFDHARVDLWLARQVEAAARASGDDRVLGQALTEIAELCEDPWERAAAELRVAEVVAGQRSAGQAARRLERAVREAPGYPFAAEALARLSLADGEVEDAAEGLERAAEAAGAKPRAAALLEEAGALWEDRAGDRRRAADAYLRAAEASPSPGAALLDRLLQLEGELGDGARLATCVEAGLSRGDLSADAQVDLYVRLADLQEKLADDGAARGSLRSAARVAPKRHDLLVRLGALCERMKDYPGAIDALTRAGQIPDDPGAQRGAIQTLAELHIRRRDLRRARAAYERILELFPRDPVATRRLGELPDR